MPISGYPSPEEEITEVLTSAVQVFGSEQKANTWMHTANIGLEGRKPITLINSNIGRHLILHALEDWVLGEPTHP